RWAGTTSRPASDCAFLGAMTTWSLRSHESSDKMFYEHTFFGGLMRQLSERQERMLQFIEDYMDEHGRPPTVRDIGVAVGISSTSVVDYNLRVLERDGHLRRERELSRGIE